MKKLPDVFDRQRFHLPKDLVPHIVMHYPDSSVLPDLDEIATTIGPDGHWFTVFFSRWWVEGENFGLLVVSGKTEDGKFEHAIAIFTRSGCADRFLYRDGDWDPHEDPAMDYGRKLACKVIMQVGHDLYLRTEKKKDPSVNTLMRSRPRFHVRRGDTIRYTRIDDIASAAGQHRVRDYTPPEEPSGIRKREHDVRGHWRTYRSGVRVWVKAHTRGDPDLGRVTRVIQA